MQVDKVNTCVVYNDMNDGFKFSVRSCIKEVSASELAAFLAKGIGSGGGHLDKAGGYISKQLFEEKYPNMNSEMYFSRRMDEYYASFDIIYASDFNAKLDVFKMYLKKNLSVGFVRMTDIAPVGTPITCRTIEGDLDIKIEEDLIVMIGVNGEAYPNRLAKFTKSNRIISNTYNFDECVSDKRYVPTVINRNTGKVYDLTKYAGTCQSMGRVTVYAQPLERGVKIFTAWDKTRYMVGNVGDYIAVRSDDHHDVYVIEKSIFAKSYKEIGEIDGE